MKRVFATIAALVAAQAALLGLWYSVERSRNPVAEQESTPSVATRRTTPMDRPLPDLELRRRDGSALRLSETRGRPLVLHFWATWCPPCRDELPTLLAYAEREEVTVLAVSLDPSWPALRRFIGEDPPPWVVLADGSDVESAFDVRSLPVTFLVSSDGRLRLRLDGPRDWSSERMLPRVRQVAGQ